MRPPQCRRSKKPWRIVKDIEAYSERIKFGALFSNFTETTNIRINGVYPEKEFAALPQMLSRII